MTQFQDKVVWITGASSGYGKALALAFGAAGARVILSARRKAELEDVAGMIGKAQAMPVTLDLEKSETFPGKCREAISAFGHIDIVIHNGALGQNGTVLETAPEIARKIMEVDYFSYTELTRCLLPHFLERGAGHIVAVSGLIIAATAPGRSSYAAAKAALFGYFGCLRAEVVNSNIGVTILIPGAMQTDLVAKALKADGSIVGGAGTTTGCTVEEAARQSLEVIADRKYQAYVGDEAGRQRWELFQRDPEQLIAGFLQMFRK